MKALFFLMSCFLATLATVTLGSKELLLVQAIWRHGDRSPTKTYASDPYQEDSWTFGGTGWGQLSPKGMYQHLKLGAKIRKRYVDGDTTVSDVTKFLNPKYNSHEIYIRSTDVNRTIISAVSNMIGMYGQPTYGNEEGVDYPNNTDVNGPIWPKGFIPIAMHTVDDDTDYIGNADADCDRQTQLWDMAKSSDELQTYINSPSVNQTLTYLTQHCGEQVDIDNLWIIADSFLIEGLWQPTFYTNPNLSWYSADLNSQTVLINDQVELYQNGVFNSTLIMKGLNIGLEIQKIRGGSITNDILMHANVKLDCWLNKTTGDKCKWIKNLKYYHDTTIYAYFSCLGIQSAVVTPHGYPKYSAATFFELWYDHDTNTPLFRLMYHEGEDTDFYPVTQNITECEGNDFCDLGVYSKIAARVKPDQPMDQWCQVNPNTQMSKSGPTLSLSSFIGTLSATILLAMLSPLRL